MSKEYENVDFKRADELPKKTTINVDLSIIDDAPTTRKERINCIMETILDGEEKHKGHNIQALISKFTIRFGAKRKTIIEYLETLQNVGYTFIDSNMKVRPTEKGAALGD